MLILGCDVYPANMKGAGEKTLLKMIHEYEHQLSDDKLFLFLQHQFIVKNTLSEAAEDIYIDAIVFEPTNAMPNINAAELSQRTYLFGMPLCLLRYLEQYSPDDTYWSSRIFNGQDMSMCKGVGGCSHVFLKHKGQAIC